MSQPAPFPSRATCSPVAPEGLSVVRRSAAHATSRLTRRTASAHARPRAEDPAGAGVPDPGFGVTVEPFARCLRVTGEFDLAAVHHFECAAAMLTGGRHGDVTVDCAELRFIDAAGLGALVQLRNTVTSGGQDLVLHGVSPRVTRTFHLGGLSHLLAHAG